jgi:GNAT superfamily N-acetyltransferase
MPLCNLLPDSDVKIYYLEMHSADELNGKPNVSGLAVDKRQASDFEFNKKLYSLVGAPWDWHVRMKWSDRQWQDYVASTKLHTWAAYFDGALAGYFELQEQDKGNVEIAYFGLLPDFIGQGLGGDMLTRAIESAWGLGASRVWVHTCTLDHPGALGNYQARGMQLYKTETH